MQNLPNRSPDVSTYEYNFWWTEMVCIDRISLRIYPIVFEEDVQMLLIDMGYKKMTTGGACNVYKHWRNVQAEKFLLGDQP